MNYWFLQQQQKTPCTSYQCIIPLTFSIICVFLLFTIAKGPMTLAGAAGADANATAVAAASAG